MVPPRDQDRPDPDLDSDPDQGPVPGPAPPLVQTGHSSVAVLGPWPDPAVPGPPESARPLPGFGPRSGPESGFSVPPNPYVSIIIPDLDLDLVPLQSPDGPGPGPDPDWPHYLDPNHPDYSVLDLDPVLDLDHPDLECSVCFCRFNNVFRCPKMLRCRHTFCLECLCRMNVKSSCPGAVRCPLCRGTTPLPALGLPSLDTNPAVLAGLPAAMQRVCSVRFVRSKGRLQLKRSAPLWSRQAPPCLRASGRWLDVGLPSPPSRGGGRGPGVGGAVARLTGGRACRAVLLASLAVMLVLLSGVIVFLLVYDDVPG